MRRKPLSKSGLGLGLLSGDEDDDEDDQEGKRFFGFAGSKEKVKDKAKDKGEVGGEQEVGEREQGQANEQELGLDATQQ